MSLSPVPAGVTVRAMVGISRRGFLAGTAGTAALIALGGCGDDDGGGESLPSLTTTNPPPRLDGDPFTLGVASGDPTPEAVILWTRLAPRPLARNGSGGMPPDPVDVVWEVAEDADFRRVVAQGVETATPEHGHTVHADAGGLEPGTSYRYRFRVGDATSPVGRTRTLPDDDAEVDSFALAVVNCQWLDSGRYAAYRHLADQDVDLVLHLGDYVYEYASTNPDVRPRTEIVDLDDYRLRYASYKLDPALQAVHHRAPFVATWDDHEVVNNYAGDTGQGDLDAAAVRARRAAGYQAWWEHLPVRFSPPEDGALEVYQSFAVGDLARITVLDQRQYSDVPPCRGQVVGDFGDCAEREDDRTRLGADQEDWFAEAVAADGVTWNLVGNPVVLAGVDAGQGSRSRFYLDTWDGYPDAQRRVIESLAAATNPVVLTGDYHAGMVLDVHETPFEPDTPVVAPEFMAPAISSVLFDDDVASRTPHLREQLNANGYLAVVVTPDRLTADFLAVDDVADPRSPVRSASTWRVDPGDPVARRA